MFIFYYRTFIFILSFESVFHFIEPAAFVANETEMIQSLSFRGTGRPNGKYHRN